MYSKRQAGKERNGQIKLGLLYYYSCSSTGVWWGYRLKGVFITEVFTKAVVVLLQGKGTNAYHSFASYIAVYRYKRTKQIDY